MLHQAGPVLFRGDLPEFLDAKAEFGGIDLRIQAETGDQLLAQVPACPSENSVYLP